MTAVAELCGHRWRQPWATHWDEDEDHRCELDAGHADNAPHVPRPHACRCGATTTEGATR